MPRLPYAAETLASQVQEKYKSAKYTVEGDPDGLDVNRTIKFDKTSSKWLEPLLDAIRDDRIEEYHTSKDQLVVTFSPRANADRRHPFPLTEVDEILNK